MAKTGFVPNSFQTPNDYVDFVMPHLTGEEYKVLSYATRRILGFQKRQDRISISQFTDGTQNKDGEYLDYGTGLSNETVKKCLSTLVSFGLMVRIEENDPHTNEGVLWGLQWDESKVDFDAMAERQEQKTKSQAEKMIKARSMRQTHPPSQTPPNDIERTPANGIERTPPCGIETQKTEETQGNPVKGGLSEKEIQQANAKVDAMIANSKKVKYQNREKIPEPYLEFADLYHELTDQEPTKRVIQDWFLTFEDWKQEGLQPQHIRAAFQHANRPDGGFPVGRPGALTNTAVAMKTKMKVAPPAPHINEKEVESTIQALEEKWNKTYVPKPTSLPRPKIATPTR